MAGKTLDLGSGMHPRRLDGCTAFGIDICAAGVTQDPPGEVLPVDLVTQRIPFGDGVFDRVFAHDFLEHVPRLLYLPRVVGGVLDVGGYERRNPFIELLNEVWRVLKPGGVFESCTPMVTDLQTWAGDPTHVNPVSENTFNYVCAQPGVNFEWELMRRYGFRGSFRMLHKSRRHGSHLYVEAEAVK